ncbi:hypothetical protein TPY_0478 [Sulfobacillus acidophilus TPY]|nr:hypothetical protein TPY_0478 [Sulfobacillus acidophilus TPY]
MEGVPLTLAGELVSHRARRGRWLKQLRLNKWAWIGPVAL